MRRANIATHLVALLLSCGLTAQAAKLRQVAMIDLPGDPGFNQVALANGQMVISRPATNTIEIFSPAKRRLIARISQIDDPRGIAVDDGQLRVYVALAGSNCIAVIDSQTWQVTKLIPVEHRPDKLLWVAETKTLYMTSTLDRTLSTLDPDGHRQASAVDLDALPYDLLFDPVRRVLLVSFQDRAEVAAIDSDSQIAGRFKLNASAPTGMALDHVHRRLYVAVRFAVLVLNADTGAELERIPAPGGINALVLDSTLNQLFAAGGDGSVLSIDLARNVVDHELPTDVKGYSLSYEPSRKMLFMPGGREGRSKMVILSPIPASELAPTATAAGSKPAAQTANK